MAEPGGEKGKAEAAALRRPRSTSWRLQGLSFRQIGEKEDISHEQARQDVRQFLSDVLELGKEEAEELRALENARLDALWQRFYPIAIDELIINDKDVIVTLDSAISACQKCLQISAARRQLNGLDMPIKVEVGGELGLHPIQQKLENYTDEQLLAIAGDKGKVVPMKLIASGKKKKAK